MSKQAHPFSSSSTLKRKRGTKSYEDQNEPIRNDYPNGRGVGPVIAHSATKGWGAQLQNTGGQQFHYRGNLCMLNRSIAIKNRPEPLIPYKKVRAFPLKYAPVALFDGCVQGSGGDKLASAGRSWAEVTQSSFKLPAARSGQKGPELGPVQGRARAQSVAGVPSAPTHRVQGAGEVRRESRSDLRTPTPVSSGAPVHARNRARSASDATHLKRKTVPDEPRPPLPGKSQNQGQASSSRALTSARRGSAVNKPILGDRARTGTTASTSYARAAGPLTNARAVQKGPGVAQVRAREQTVARPLRTPVLEDAAARQGLHIGLRQHEMPIPGHVSSGVPLQLTAAPRVRPKEILFPLFVHLATLASFFCGSFSADYQYKVTYVAPPPIAPSNVQTTGFYYFLLVVTVQASRLTLYQEMTGNEEIYEVFFYLALASWMSSRCNRFSFKKNGDSEHESSGSAVKNGPTGPPVLRTNEQALVHDMVKRFREHEERTVSPWIRSHISTYITQRPRFDNDEYALLSNVLHNLAYAAETMLSYRLANPNGSRNTSGEKVPFAKKLHAVGETGDNRLKLLQLFPLDNP